METRNPGDEDKNNPRNRIVNERKPLEGEGKIRLKNTTKSVMEWPPGRAQM